MPARHQRAEDVIPGALCRPPACSSYRPNLNAAELKVYRKAASMMLESRAEQLGGPALRLLSIIQRNS